MEDLIEAIEAQEARAQGTNDSTSPGPTSARRGWTAREGARRAVRPPHPATLRRMEILLEAERARNPLPQSPPRAVDETPRQKEMRSFCQRHPSQSWEIGPTLLTCAICLEDLKEGEMTRTLPCGHSFHSSCVDMWLESCPNFTCPICRAPALEE